MENALARGPTDRGHLVEPLERGTLLGPIVDVVDELGWDEGPRRAGLEPAGTGQPGARGGGRLSLLGFFSFTVHGCHVVLKPSVMRLVALLALQGPTQRQVAAETLWPDFAEGRGRANLRNALWRLRQAGGLLVVEEGEVVRLGDVDVDMDAIRGWATAALRGFDPGPLPPRFDAELLPGWSDEWLVMVREELRMLRMYALEAAAHQLLVHGRLGEAAVLGQTGLRMDCLRESAHRLLIEVSLRQGNRLDALRHYARYEAVVGEAGAAPAPDLTALIRPIRLGHCTAALSAS
jgi:DNA-binding SARP family transcriptional activator